MITTFQNRISHIFLIQIIKGLFKACSVLIVLSLLFQGCKEEEHFTQPPPGKGPQDSTGPIKVETSYNISTITEELEKTRTDALSRNMVGSYYDTTFGQMKANLFFNFDLPSGGGGFSDTFLQDRSIDSAVLTIPYSEQESHFGNINTSQTFQFHELKERIYGSNEEPYYDNDQFDYFSNPSASWRGKFDPFSNEVFRVKLSQDFVQKFENANNSELTNNENFDAFFKGLAVIPQNNFQQNRKGAILYWQLLEGADITFYHHNGMRDSIVVSPASARINTYELDRTQALAQTGDDLDFGFLQPLGGLKIRLQFPQVKDYVSSGKISVHKANVIIPVDSNYHNTVTPPDYLEIWAARGNSAVFLDTANYQPSGMKYTITKTTYFQTILNQYAENREPTLSGLHVKIPNDLPLKANPLLIPYANKNNQKGVKLKLTYSKVSEQ